MKIRLILLMALLTISAGSCRVTLVPEYSSVLEEQITNGAKLNDKLYIDLLDADNTKRGYSLFSDRYTEIESEINSIRLKNETRKNNANMIAIIDILKTNFSKFRKEHKDKTAALTDGEIMTYQSFIKGFWKPLLVAEGGLKKARPVTAASN